MTNEYGYGYVSTKYIIFFPMDGFEPQFMSSVRDGEVRSNITWGSMALRRNAPVIDPGSAREISETQWMHFEQLRKEFWRKLGAA